MKVIIAEKPSLARNIADSIGNMKKQNGYFYGTEYYVTWAFGHLFSLCDIETYTGEPSTVRWKMSNLPCFPETFQFELKKTEEKGKKGKKAEKKVDEGVERQFNVIKTLCHRTDVDGIVNAGDADREGEVIVRLCVQNAMQSETKPVYRLWLPDQTPETIRKALDEMQLDSNYDSLAGEGFARTYIDWLYGVNLTRLATLKSGALLRVGRVIVPIVQAIYERDMAIRNFIPTKYFSLVSKEKTKGEVVELTSKLRFEADEADKAQATCDRYNQLPAVVTDVTQKEEILFPGKLYSLTKLQNFLSKKYKMSMKESLDVVQGLYEKGYLTYPRTNSEYMATAEKDKVKSILSGVSRLGYPVRFKDSKSIFDDSKIESHSALTPTTKIPSKDALSQKEKDVYSAVLRRFVAVFCAENCKVSKSEITIDLGDEETFSLKGTVVLEPGWTKYDPDNYTQKDKVLPNLDKGDRVNINFLPVEKETTAPKHYTVETLNNYLKNPFKEEKKALESDDGTIDDAEEYRAVLEGLELGTEATRTGIIDNARSSQYIDLKKDTYYILPQGEFLVQSLERMGINMDKNKTGEIGKALKRVFNNRMTVDESVTLAENEIRSIFDSVSRTAETGDGFYGETVGTCPLCGKNLLRGRYGYDCEGNKDKTCPFHVGLTICSKGVSIEDLNDIITLGKTKEPLNFISPKSHKPFDAYLVLDKTTGKVGFEFPSKAVGGIPRPPMPGGDTDGTDKPVGQSVGLSCPVCGKDILVGRFNYGCRGNIDKTCTFTVGLNICSKDVTLDELKQIVTEGRTSLLTFVSSKTKKPFDAALVLDKKTGKVGFEFPDKPVEKTTENTTRYIPRPPMPHDGMQESDEPTPPD